MIDEVEGPFDLRRVDDIALDEVNVGGERDRTRGGEVVEGDDVGPVGQQPVREVVADESGPTGDQSATHRPTPA